MDEHPLEIRTGLDVMYSSCTSTVELRVEFDLHTNRNEARGNLHTLSVVNAKSK